MATVIVIFFIILIKNTLALTTWLLNNSMYKAIPIITPINMKKRISPLLKVNIEYSTKTPVRIQNNISSMYVTKFDVLKLFRNILKKSNNKPIIIPSKVKIKNKYA